METTPTGVLYWNIHQNEKCLAALTELVAERKPGVVMLAECPFDDVVVLAALDSRYRAFSSAHLHVRFYASAVDFTIENDSLNRLVVARLGSGPTKMLLVGLHLPSKLFGSSPNNQATAAEEFRRIIREQEQLSGIYRTVIFGDFNMNAYEWGMVERNRGFRTVPTRQLALQSIARGSTETRRFYNPMWAWMGDFVAGSATAKPAGTYYRSPQNPEDSHWNSLDAVIVSPEAIAHFDVASLEVVTQTAAAQHVLFNGAIAARYSDHLPLHFNLLLS